MSIKLYYNGKFLKNSFFGGKSIEINNIRDIDSFGFSIVTEHIKESLDLDEIGGVYVQGKKGGWDMIKDDDDVLEYVHRYGDADWPFYIDTIIDKSI